MAAAGALYFTPLPYLPLNHLLSHSTDMSGRISGSVLTGITINDFKCKSNSGAEFSADEITVRYEGLSYLLKNELVINEINWSGIKANLPHGIFTDWGELRQKYEARLFLIPPMPKKQVSVFRMENFIIEDVDFFIGKSVPTGLPSGNASVPWALLTPRLFGQGKISAVPSGSPNPKSGALAPAPRKILDELQINNLSLANIQFRTSESTGTSRLGQLKLENLVMGKNKFDLAAMALATNSFYINIKKTKESGSTWESAVLDMKGLMKPTPLNQLKKEVPFNGGFMDKKLSLAFFDNKVVYTFGKPPGVTFPSMSLNVTDLSFPDYYNNVVPVAHISCSIQNFSLLGIQKPTPIRFQLGATPFEGELAPFSILTRATSLNEMVIAQSMRNRQITAKMGINMAVPGKIQVQLVQIPQRLSPSGLLANVWTGKNNVALKPKERVYLASIAPYFGIDPQEFEIKQKTRPVGRKGGKRKKR